MNIPSSLKRSKNGTQSSSLILTGFGKEFDKIFYKASPRLLVKNLFLFFYFFWSKLVIIVLWLKMDFIIGRPSVLVKVSLWSFKVNLLDCSRRLFSTVWTHPSTLFGSLVTPELCALWLQLPPPQKPTSGLFISSFSDYFPGISSFFISYFLLLLLYLPLCDLLALQTPPSNKEKALCVRVCACGLDPSSVEALMLVFTRVSTLYLRKKKPCCIIILWLDTFLLKLKENKNTWKLGQVHQPTRRQ